MPQATMWQILVLVTRIYVLTIPITVVLTSDINASEFDYGISSTTAKSIISGFNGAAGFNIMCAKYCVCSRTPDGSNIVARCRNWTDETYFVSNSVSHLILKNVDNITLGPHEFRARGLIHLESIEIIHCRTVVIDRSAFDDLQYLISVRLLFNEELDTHQDIFQNNFELEYLNINEYYQSRNSCNMSSDYLFDAPSVIEFSMSDTNYNCWSPSTFSKMPSLSYLKLERQNFQLVPGIFAPLGELAKLEMLHINHINITKEAFKGTKLHTLILAYSVVTSLANIEIDGLKYLHMEHNVMENIGENDFIGIPALEKLELINSDIETIHGAAFSHLTELKYLNIGGNKIVEFSDNHLRNNYQLEVLLMAYNKNLKSLPVFKLNSTDNNNFTIHEFDCCSCGLESVTAGTFNAMPALTRLTLEGNLLKELPRGLFKPLSSLKSLDLSKNFISNIPNDMFEGAIKLTQLNLAENKLTTLQMTPFLQTPELLDLDVSQCQIQIWNKTSAPLTSLRFLSLHGNKLEHIAVEQLETVPYLSLLMTLQNPIKCDNELDKMIEWLELHGVGTTVDIPTSSHCDSQFDNKSCWDVFQRIFCGPNHISRRNCKEQNNRTGSCTDNMTEYRIKSTISHWYYGDSASLIITLFAAVATIILITTIIIVRSRLNNQKMYDRLQI